MVGFTDATLFAGEASIQTNHPRQVWLQPVYPKVVHEDADAAADAEVLEGEGTDLQSVASRMGQLSIHLLKKYKS